MDNPTPDTTKAPRRRRHWFRRLMRLAMYVVLIPLALLMVTVMVAGCWFSAPTYSGPKSDHFDGSRFFNPDMPERKKGFRQFLAWQFNRQQGHWDDYREAEPGEPPETRVEGSRLVVTHVGHSTVLIQTRGLNILTDPQWSDRASPVGWAGPRRRTPPGIRFDELPPIDVVLISHNHYDHLDEATVKQLLEAHDPSFYVPLGNSAFLNTLGVERTTDMDWWESVELSPGVTLHCVPARHFANRGLFDRAGTLWAGFVVSTPDGAIYFAGDTGWGPQFEQVRDRLGPIRISMLPIGAYLPRWFMSPVHTSPAEAVKAHVEMGSPVSLPIHYGTFPLGDDGQDQGVDDLVRARTDAGLPEEAFPVKPFGQAWEIPPLEPTPRPADRLD